MLTCLAAYIRKTIYLFHVEILEGDELDEPLFLGKADFPADRFLLSEEIAVGFDAGKTGIFFELGGLVLALGLSGEDLSVRGARNHLIIMVNVII
jgi:hypothetical protein